MRHLFNWVGPRGLFHNHDPECSAFVPLNDLLCLSGCGLREGMSVTQLYFSAPAQVLTHCSMPADRNFPHMTAEP